MDILSIFSAIPAIAVIFLFIVVGIVVLEVVVLLKKKGKKAPAPAGIPQPGTNQAGPAPAAPMENFAVTGVNPQVANDTGPASPADKPATPADVSTPPATPPPVTPDPSPTPVPSPADASSVTSAKGEVSDKIGTKEGDVPATPAPPAGGPTPTPAPATDQPIVASGDLPSPGSLSGPAGGPADGSGNTEKSGGTKLKLSRKQFTLAGLAVLVVVAIPTTIFLVGQRQDTRSSAAVIQDVPTQSIASLDPNIVNITSLPGQGKINIFDTADVTEPDRTQPSFVFVNGTPSGGSVKLSLSSTSGVTIDADLANLQISEQIIDPGTYSVKITDSTGNTVLHETELDIESDTVNILIRDLNGSFTSRVDSYLLLPALRFYNLTNDDTLAIHSGTILEYDLFHTIFTNNFLDPIQRNTTQSVFVIGSTIDSLHQRIINISNTARSKVMLFALGNNENSILSAVITPLSSEFKGPLSTQDGVHDPTPEWCEGVYVCNLVDANCSDCGKSCFVATDSCDPTANGGSGLDWNGDKTVKPIN